MNRITDIDELATELLHWHGARAKLWSYHVSLQRLAIRLERDAGKRNLLIICSPCLQINAPVFWQVHDCRLESVYQEDIERVIYHLLDQAAGVEIRCAAISAKRDAPPFFTKQP